MVASLLASGTTPARAMLYVDAFVEYSAAQENIQSFGSVVCEPKTGSPIPNPYLPIRDKAFARLEALHKLNVRPAWMDPKAPEPAGLMSQRAYARHLHVTEGAVRKAIKAGRITTVGGKIDPGRADREWQANTRSGQAGSRVAGRAEPGAVPAGPWESTDGDGLGSVPGGNGSGADFAAARAARELYQSQVVKLGLDRQRGLLVRVDEVEKAAFALARKTRDQLRAIPDRLAAVLAAVPEPAEVRRILEEEVERICQEFAGAERG